MGPGLSATAESVALGNYQAAMHFYIWAVKELSRHADPLPHEDFERLRTTVEYALDLYQTSRWALERARQAVLQEMPQARDDYARGAP